MKQVKLVMDYFQEIQKTYGYRETGNLLMLQWDFRMICEQIPNGEELRLLIQFFCYVSDDKSMDCFKYEYADMRESMREKIREMSYLENLQKETVKGKKKV